MATPPTSPIDRLVPEVLLEIFKLFVLDSREDIAALLSSILCCQKWRPLASSVLYGHVVLDEERLRTFLTNRTRCKLTSLTITLHPMGINPSDPAPAIAATNARKAYLQRLSSIIAELNPTTLSVSVDLPFPYTAAPEIVAIMDNLPEPCTALEIDLKHSGSFVPHITPDSVQPPPHLCDWIRHRLPLLEHLRLRLPQLCPSIICDGLQDQGTDARAAVVRAPLLRTCLINLSLRKPDSFNQGAWTTECRESQHRTPHIGQLDQLPSALPAMEGVIRGFVERNDENLKRLWVMDVQPHDPAVMHGYPSWIRRDFLARESFPIPIWNMGIFSGGTCAARIPSLTDPGEVEDWVSQVGPLEILAEGGTWTETRTGTRMPIQDIMMDNKSRALPHDDRLLSAQRYREETRSTSLIWQNEDATTQVLLPRGPGELMKRWEVVEMIPSGWRRDNFNGAPLMKIA